MVPFEIRNVIFYEFPTLKMDKFCCFSTGFSLFLMKYFVIFSVLGIHRELKNPSQFSQHLFCGPFDFTKFITF